MCLLSPNTQPQGGRDGAESTAQHVTRKGLERRTQEAGHTPSGSHAGAFGSSVAQAEGGVRREGSMR